MTRQRLRGIFNVGHAIDIYVWQAVMVWVKICGVRDVETAKRVAACQPDAIGLNFYAKSVRSVSLETAQAIVRSLPPQIEAVGVFVNATAAEVAEQVAQCQLDRVQFHGDESPELLAEFRQLSPVTSLVRAWRRTADGLSPLAAYLSRCNSLKVKIAAVLIDAHVPDEYGGTGHVLPWEELHRECASLALPRLILAGGLTPQNVSTSVQAVSPWGVDVASGVESAPGVKDLDAVARFIQSARAADLKTPHT